MFTYLKKHPAWLLTILLALVFMMVPTIAGAQCDTFLCLTDTPGSYGTANTLYKINSSATGIVEADAITSPYWGALTLGEDLRVEDKGTILGDFEVFGDARMADGLLVNDETEMIGQSIDTTTSIRTFSTGNEFGPVLRFFKSDHSTVYTYRTTDIGDDLGSLQHYGVNTSNATALAASIAVEQQDDAATGIPADITFSTGLSAGGVGEVMTLTEDQNVEVTNDLDVGGDLTIEGDYVGDLSVGGDVAAGDDLTVASNATITGHLAVGTTPSEEVEIHDTAHPTVLSMRTFATNNAYENIIRFDKSDSNTDWTWETTDDGEEIGTIAFRGVNDSDTVAYGAYIIGSQVGDSAGYVPTQLRFLTSDGSANPTQVMALNEDQDVEITNDLTVGSAGSGRVSVGSTVHAQELEVRDVGHPSTTAIRTFSTSNGHGSELRFYKSDVSTDNSYVQTDEYDDLGGLFFYGVNSSPSSAYGAYMQVVQEGAAGASYVPASMRFYTSDGTATPGKVLELTEDQDVEVTNDLSVSGGTTLNTLWVSGSAAMDDSLVVTQDIHASQNIIADNNLEVDDDAAVGGDLAVGGSVTVVGNADVTQMLTADDIVATDELQGEDILGGTVYGNWITSGYNITAGDDLISTDDTEVGDDLLVDGKEQGGSYATNTANYTHDPFLSVLSIWDTNQGGTFSWAADDVTNTAYYLFDEDDVGGPKWIVQLNYACAEYDNELGNMSAGTSTLTNGTSFRICEVGDEYVTVAWEDTGNKIYLQATPGERFRVVLNGTWLND